MSSHNGRREEVTERDGEIKRWLLDKTHPEMMSNLNDRISTMYDGVMEGSFIVSRSEAIDDQRALGRRVKMNGGELSDAFKWITYEQMLDRSNAIASGLIGKFDAKPGQQTFIGILSINCPEWLIVSIACYMQSWVIVPLYQTVPDDALAHICAQCELSICFVKNADDARRLIGLKELSKIKVEIIISFETLDESAVRRGAGCGIKMSDFDDLISSVQQTTLYCTHLPPKPDDLIIICYTSGTTGTPKGVMLTHGNMISIVSCQSDWMRMIVRPGQEYYLSYLPLAHILEFGVENFCLCNGFKIGYYSGDVKKLSSDIKLVRPTLFTTVPRVLNRICADIKARTSWRKLGLFKFLLFRLAYRFKLRQLTSAASSEDRFVPPSLMPCGVKAAPGGWLSTNEAAGAATWTDRVFQPIRSQFGGRLKIILVGSSPSVPEILLFMKVVMGCPIIEGYGQTECCGASHTQPFFDMSIGNVGRPLRCCEMKLEPVSDLSRKQNQSPRNDNCFAPFESSSSSSSSSQQQQQLDAAGELCIRGYNVFKGYYKDKQTTDLVLDQEGWLHTGDIATMCPRTGVVSIVDRKNEIFKLSQGEYIVPSKIESAYYQCDVVLHCMVHGDPYQNYTVAIIVPERDVLLRYAQKHGIISKADANRMSAAGQSNEEFSRLCQNQVSYQKHTPSQRFIAQEINQMVLAMLHNQATLSQLSGVERVKRIYLHPDPLTSDEGLITPTLKIRRSACVRRFRKEIDNMYKE